MFYAQQIIYRFNDVVLKENPQLVKFHTPLLPEGNYKRRLIIRGLAYLELSHDLVSRVSHSEKRP